MSPGGSVLFGSTVCHQAPGEWFKDPRLGHTRYLHSIDSLKALLAKFGFSKIDVSKMEYNFEDSLSKGPNILNLIYPDGKFDGSEPIDYVQFTAYKQ